MLTNEDLQAIRLLMQEEINPVKDGLKGEINGLKSEMQSIKEETHGIKEEVHSIKEEVHSIKEELSELREATNFIAGWVESVEKKVDAAG